jgi:hypothetical protein
MGILLPMKDFLLHKLKKEGIIDLADFSPLTMLVVAFRIGREKAEK